jgi:hypothetical protein
MYFIWIVYISQKKKKKKKSIVNPIIYTLFLEESILMSLFYLSFIYIYIYQKKKGVLFYIIQFSFFKIQFCFSTVNKLNPIKYAHQNEIIIIII